MDGTRRALDAVRTAPTILEAINRFPALSAAAAADDPRAAFAHLRAVIAHPRDDVVAIGAVHALAAVRPTPPTPAHDLLADLLTHPSVHLREHAVWALESVPPVPRAVPELGAMVAAGGFPGTLAERTLEVWRGCDGADAGVAADSLAIDSPAAGSPERRGITMAQVFLHAEIDGSLRHAGQGDTGGIATLLVHLAEALTGGPTGVDRVLTISRGESSGLEEALRHVTEPGNHYLGLPLERRRAADSWVLRPAARDGIRRVLRAAGQVDVIHLRMADVGSWVAAEVARDLGIPVVLTLAPDPHALIAQREAEGSLTRHTFGAADHAEHLVFRVQLLRDLADQAAQLVVFPRPDLARDMRVLLGIDPSRESHRVTVVPEGIDVAAMDRTLLDVRAATPSPATAGALAELDALLATLPPGRRDLPLALSVGRLHRVKGMATLVETWARHPELAERCNLLIVGGDLDDPNADEKEQLDRIHALRDRHPDAPVGGLLLAGHRPNSTVAVWLAAARFGRPGLAAPHGVYVSASLKEEFGIAILEAMAAGLVVVAPDGGGPATYVDDGVTGYLVDTTSRGALAEAIVDALDLAAAPGTEERAEEARALVRGQFSIDTMAATLGAVYQQAVARRRAGTAERETPS